MTGREGEDVTAPESMAKLWHEIIVDRMVTAACCRGAVGRNRYERWLR